MSVEVVSIVSSGVAALGSVALTVGFGTYNAREQRAHEKTLADKAAESEHRLSYGSRAWDRKVEAHLDVIKSLSRLDRIMTRVDTPGVAIEHLVTSTLMALNDAQPVIIAYGSEQCRDDLARMIDLAFEVMESTPMAVVRLARASVADFEKAMAAGDAEEATAHRTVRFDALADVAASTRFDRDEIVSALHAGLDSVRASLRGDT